MQLEKRGLSDAKDSGGYLALHGYVTHDVTTHPGTQRTTQPIRQRAVVTCVCRDACRKGVFILVSRGYF